MAMSDISVDEILAELERLTGSSSNNEEFHTASKLTKMWGVTRGRVHKILDEAHELGVLECVRVREVGKHGGMVAKPAYRIDVDKLRSVRKQAKPKKKR